MSPHSPIPRFLRRAASVLLSLGALCLTPSLIAQDTPLISGAGAFLTRTNGGKTSYTPTLAPVLVAPVGNRLLFETRANVVEGFSPTGPHQTYDHFFFLGVAYAQADYFVNRHMTLVGGYFLIPFGSYNERLTPLWISNLQDAPLIYGLGNVGSGAGTGGEIRGNAYSSDKLALNYIAYASAGSTNYQISSSRSAGGQVNIFLPKAGLELGTSYARILEQTRTANDFGAHLWWEPQKFPLKLRSEYAHGIHSQGYWMEADYRLSQFKGPDSALGRLEPVVRFQQTFRRSPGGDQLPAVNTNIADFGLDYHLPHEVRINTSYSRRFASNGNFNLWETSLVYRFLFPGWKGRK